MSDGPLHLRLFGLDVDVDVQPEHRESIARQWQWCAPDSPVQREISPLRRPGDPVPGAARRAPGEHLTETRGADGDDGDVHAADYRLTTSLTGRAIAERAGELVMLHAGGVAHPETGVVAGLVAASGTGKTTATRHFCANGYGYVTDESLIFNDVRAVMPYPKPLSVLIHPDQPGAKTQHGPQDLGLAQPPAGDLTLGPIILLDRVREPDEELATPQLTEVSLFAGLALILPQSSALPQIPDCLHLLAHLAVDGGGLLQLRYREIAQTDHLLRAAFDVEPQPVFWRHVPGTWNALTPNASRYAPMQPDIELTAAPLGDDRRLTLAPFVDALLDEERCEALVLFGSTPAHLQGIGAVVFETLLEGPRTLAELVAACTQVLGEHPEAHSLVSTAVGELAETGVVRGAAH